MDRETVIEMILDPASRPVPGSAEHQAFLACLERSPELRAMYEEQQAVWEALDLWQNAEPSPGFDRAVYEKIERRPAGFWGRWLSWPLEGLATLRPGVAAGLAALLLIAAAIVSFQPRRGDEPVAATQAAEQQASTQQLGGQQAAAERASGPQDVVARASGPQAPRIESESVEQIDQALDDIEMLADFDGLLIEPRDPGRS